MAENGRLEPREVPKLAEMTLTLYADGNFAYSAPIGNPAVCYTLLGMMNAEMACLQFQRTRREGGQIVMAEGVPTKGPTG